MNIETTEKENNIWQANKKRIIENFTVLDDKKFWKDCLNEEDFQNHIYIIGNLNYY